METKINLSEDLARELRKFSSELGISENSEFIEEAIKEKIMELRKKRFFEISDEVSKGLDKKEISHEEILDDFEKRK